jgi:hypothetical protein
VIAFVAFVRLGRARLALGFGFFAGGFIGRLRVGSLGICRRRVRFGFGVRGLFFSHGVFSV